MDRKKPKIAVYISIAVFSIAIIAVLVMTMSEVSSVFDLFVTDKQRYEGVFGLDFDKAADIPHIPDWIVADDLPKYIDMGLTHFAYIRDNERPSQEALDYVFGLVADEIGDELDEQLLVELTDDLAETVVNAFRAPHTDSAISAWAYTVIPGRYDVLLRNTVFNTVKDGRGNSIHYRIYIHTHYKANGEITRSARYTEDSITYIVSSMDNDYLSKWNGKKNTYEGYLRDGEYIAFRDDIFAGLVPSKGAGEIYLIEFVRDYLAAKRSRTPMDSTLAMSDVGEYAYVVYAAGPIENDIFPEVYKDPFVFGRSTHEIPGSSVYTNNPTDVIAIRTYYTRGHYAERSADRECFTANMSIADIVSFALGKPNADVNVLPLLKTLGKSVAIINGKETAGRCIDFAREGSFSALEIIDFVTYDNKYGQGDLYLQPLHKELRVSLAPVQDPYFDMRSNLRRWQSDGPPWDDTRVVLPIERYAEERAVLYYEACKVA